MAGDYLYLRQNRYPNMTRRRWIADEVSGNQAALTGQHASHLIRVLRARVGQEFDIAADGIVRRGRILTIQQGRVEFGLGEEVAELPVPNVSLLLAIFKFDRLEWAIEKCTELGVARLIPVIARRTDAHLASAAERRCERWRRIALQAAEQSRRAAPPEIVAPMPLKEAAKPAAGSHKIVLAESEEQTLLRDAVAGRAGAEIILGVGPEGGWAEDELEFFKTSGWISASLGETILRAETAAIAAIAVTMSELTRD
jgi:16S rRNA (uracil1498-N3)-methyltransferase